MSVLVPPGRDSAWCAPSTARQRPRGADRPGDTLAAAHRSRRLRNAGDRRRRAAGGGCACRARRSSGGERGPGARAPAAVPRGTRPKGRWALVRAHGRRGPWAAIASPLTWKAIPPRAASSSRSMFYPGRRRRSRSTCPSFPPVPATSLRSAPQFATPWANAVAPVALEASFAGAPARVSWNGATASVTGSVPGHLPASAVELLVRSGDAAHAVARIEGPSRRGFQRRAQRGVASARAASARFVRDGSGTRAPPVSRLARTARA